VKLSPVAHIGDGRGRLRQACAEGAPEGLGLDGVPDRRIMGNNGDDERRKASRASPADGEVK